MARRFVSIVVNGHGSSLPVTPRPIWIFYGDASARATSNLSEKGFICGIHCRIYCLVFSFFSFLKNSRRDQQGTPPLKHDDILYSDTKTKANLFNQQFNSDFTPKEPLSPSRLAKMRVEDLNKAGSLPSDTIPDTSQDSATTMPEINISQNGLLKLLKNLKPSKAAGPDKVKPLLLRELREEITPIIKIIFDRSLQTGKLPADWLKANVMPAFKKGDKSLAANY